MTKTPAFALSLATVAALTALTVTAPAEAQSREERREARREADALNRSSEVSTPHGALARESQAKQLIFHNIFHFFFEFLKTSAKNMQHSNCVLSVHM